MKPKIHSQSLDHPELAATVAGLVSLALHYSGAVPLGPEAIGATMCAVLMPLAMFAIRLASRLMGKASGEDGRAEVPAVILMLALGVAWLLIGCGSSYHLKAGGMKVAKQADGQTCAQIYGDGDPDVVRVCFKDVKIKLPAGACDGAE
jgi:hypothetical protein